MKSMFVLNSKKQWQPVKQHPRNWVDLPYDVMVNILYRVGVYDILENAQKVCTTWRKICKDPSMWRVIKMDDIIDYPEERSRLLKMCKHVVDQSQGQLVDLTICHFANEELLEYIANRSSQLRRLEFAFCHNTPNENWAKSLKKFPLLEELNMYVAYISPELIAIVAIVGHYCPMLTTLKINCELGLFHRDSVAIAIGTHLPKLKHLELISNFMSNIGLQAIMDGCRHLELLDLRHCFGLDLEGEFGKCLKNIKCLKLPNDSLEDCMYIDLDGP